MMMFFDFPHFPTSSIAKYLFSFTHFTGDAMLNFPPMISERLVVGEEPRVIRSHSKVGLRSQVVEGSSSTRTPSKGEPLSSPQFLLAKVTFVREKTLSLSLSLLSQRSVLTLADKKSHSLALHFLIRHEDNTFSLSLYHAFSLSSLSATQLCPSHRSTCEALLERTYVKRKV